ncbi:hypothetical protein Angca_000965, partial [Angiostrongylus cantonensis]
MTGLWVLYSFIVIGLLYYVCYNVFIDNANTKPYSNSVEVVGMNEATNNAVEDAKLGDVFDTCPFELPDPWDSAILKYVDVKYGFLKDCAPNVTLQPITELKNATVTIKEHEGFSCEARCINYVDDNNYEATGWKSIEKNEFKCDFVETSCRSNTTTNRFIHTQISEQTSPNEKILNSLENLDVHLIVIDSVASTQIIRLVALPRTINFLLHGMGAIEFRKFNKVGSNSRPNAFATLLGKTTEAVVRTQMNLPTIEADFTYKQLCKQYLDDYPYIPLEYMKAGYKTFGGEDYVTSVLNYPDCYGMKRKQFHHIYRTKNKVQGTRHLTYFIILLKFLLFLKCRPFYLRLSKDDELKSIHEKSVCRESRNNVVDYLSKFLDSYKVNLFLGLSKFSLSWLVDLAHDNTHDLYRADYDLYEFFVSNRDAEANTDFGKQEGNNPFLYVITPRNLRHTTIYNQLRRNSEELVTHHDLHSTFKDILYVVEKYVLSNENTTFSATVNDYNLVFEVAPPAKGQFQIPIRTERGEMKIGEERFIRLDKYGNNGDCVANDILRPLCTCK